MTSTLSAESTADAQPCTVKIEKLHVAAKDAGQRMYRRRDYFWENGERRSIDDIMIEVSPNYFVNDISARKLRFIGGHEEGDWLYNDSRAVNTKEHRPRLKGDHPYRADTRFKRREDGTFTMEPLCHVKDEAAGRRLSTPEGRAEGRDSARKKATIEKRAITRLRNKIEKRQNIGDPGCVQSRDEDFPLLAVLRRDKLDSLIAAVMAYRQLVALCETEPLKGQQYGQSNGVEREYETRKMIGIEDVDRAASAGFMGNKVPGGEIVYERRARKSDCAYDIPARRILAAEITDDGTPTGGRTESLHVKINEDTIAAYIDGKPRLARIRAALGPLLDPVEDAVLGGQTLETIGRHEGFSGSSAAPAGKAVVYRGIAVIDGFLGHKKFEPTNDNYLIEKKKLA